MNDNSYLQRMTKYVLPVLVSIFLHSVPSHAQDAGSKVKQIDSLVAAINRSNLKVQSDSIKQNQPLVGMSSKTYITIALDGKELKKYTTRINMLMTEDGVTRQMNTSTIMYFDKGALIKVEEFTQKDDLSKAFDWYFESGKPLYYTLPPDEVADERAEFLLSMADTVLKRVQ